jgi:hypothetical protein
MAVAVPDCRPKPGYVARRHLCGAAVWPQRTGDLGRQFGLFVVPHSPLVPGLLNAVNHTRLPVESCYHNYHIGSMVTEAYVHSSFVSGFGRESALALPSANVAAPSDSSILLKFAALPHTIILETHAKRKV